MVLVAIVLVAIAGWALTDSHVLPACMSHCRATCASAKLVPQGVH